MLAILYITSAMSSFLTLIFEDQEKYKKYFTFLVISILSGLLYAILMVNKIIQNLFEPHFWTVFGLLSLVFWDFAFLSNDGANWLSYIVSAFLGSAVLCCLLSNIYFSDYLVTCNENHDYTERVAIVTTIDGSEYGESIYGDGFAVGFIVKPYLNTGIYKYYYQTEGGQIRSKEIYENRVQITYIDADADPYIEIYHAVDCFGYRNESKTHVFKSSFDTYHLYIPENSITNIAPAS